MIPRVTGVHMLKIKRFKLKEGCEPPSRVYCDLGHSVSVLQDWGRKGAQPSDSTWDLDWFIVLDEEFCQPYTPFYEHIDDDVEQAGPAVLPDIVANYNRFMSSLSWLEEA